MTLPQQSGLAVKYTLYSSIVWLAIACLGWADDTGLYDTKIKPLLAEKCSTCHGTLRSEAGLRLDAIQFIREGGDSGKVAMAGMADESELLRRVTDNDADTRMPPAGEGTPMTGEQINLLRIWIDEGLQGPDQEAYLTGPQDHWAFRPIARPSLPEPVDKAGQQGRAGQGDRADQVDRTPHGVSPIDLLLSQIHDRRGLNATSRATDLAWLRRVFLDLIGILPSVDEIAAFQEDISPNRKQKVVERLLDSPKYGERWGRHWMDVWRYSDWDGYKNELRGSQRHIWHWRDWIIESLNDNKPYDQMILEMLAADEIAPGDLSSVRATGFLARNYHKSNRDIWLDATVEHTGKAFLGLTLNCARCHDHKFDPISQETYYRFRAVFEPHEIRTEQLPGVSDITKDGIPRAFDAKLDAETYLYVRGNEKQPRKDNPISAGVLDFLPIAFQPAPVALPLESYYPAMGDVARENRLDGQRKAVSAARAALDRSLAALDKTALIAEAPDSLSARNQQIESHRVTSAKYELAIAQEHAWLARYAAEDAKYRAPEHKHGAKSDGAKNDGGMETQFLVLARAAALAEHREHRIAAELDVLQKDAALTKAKRSDEKDDTKRTAAIAAAEKAANAARKKLSEIPAALDADDRNYSPVGDVLPSTSSGRRLALARWLTDPSNPLPARVAVNQIWMRHFGSPLVENVFDFGMKNPQPELLEVLDWLAAEFLESGWDMKHLHRILVLSDAYARSSHTTDNTASSAAYDPDNRLFWRANVQRLDAEQIRDSMLSVSGDLDHSFSGPDIDFHQGESTPRRSVYFQHAYEKQMSMLVLFDAASPNECYCRKPSVIPQQALVLINSSLARTASRRLTAKLMRDPVAQTSSGFIKQLFQATLTRLPSQEERAECLAFLKEQAHALSDKDSLSTHAGGDQPATPAHDDPAVRARESLALVLLNHNDFLSVR